MPAISLTRVVDYKRVKFCSISEIVDLYATCVGVAIMNNPFMSRIGSAGMPLAGLKVKLRDTGSSPGEGGEQEDDKNNDNGREIMVSGRSVMMGYLNQVKFAFSLPENRFRKEKTVF